MKITLGEMRATGVRDLLVYCADYKCVHAVRVSADRWPDHIRLSDLEPLFVCQACGRRGADIRPDWDWELSRGARVASRGWKRLFDEPIPLPRGRRLATLEDAGNYITKLPKAEHEAKEWQAATEA